MRIVIFGAGMFGKEYYEKLLAENSPEVEVVAFVDNDKQKQKSGYMGLDVIAPEALDDVVYDQIYIATCANDEVKDQLTKIGIPVSKMAERESYEVNVRNVWLKYYASYI